METNEIQIALASAVEEVLETMCFATVLDSAEGCIPLAGGPASSVTAELHFHGNPSGGFRMGVPLKLARVMGSGFLGREEMEVSDSQAEEVVCELANMMCGSVLSRLESKGTFQIARPVLVPQEHGVNVQGGGANRWFDLGDGILTVALELQPAV